MIMDVWSNIVARLRKGQPCVLVTVFAAKGSVPREAGARMIVCTDGGFTGTIGGGELEWQAIAHARKLISDHSSGFQVRKFSLGPDLGQCCGGQVSLGFEPFDVATLEMVARLADHAANRESFTTRGILDDKGRVHRVVLDGHSPDYGPETALIEPSGSLLERFGEWRRTVFLFGAGHVARALVLMLAPHPFSIRWIDTRDDAFPRHFPQNTSACRVDIPASVLDDAPSDAFVLVMTHSHALDEEIVSAALANESFAYVGLIGSDTKKARFLKRLNARGHSRSMIDRLICPIGIAGIESKTPAAIATSVAAQILLYDEAVRREADLPIKSQTVSTG